ncbi:hypothetical protein C4568_03450 [Candidatus Parcubacteria bacterium]|nr:MAG: hypothetical protein C4568_03450 [Candidatus Parcubacteria bacterium]
MALTTEKVNFNMGDHELTVYFHHQNSGFGTCFKCEKQGQRENVVVTEVVDRGVQVAKGTRLYGKAAAHARRHLGHRTAACRDHLIAYLDEYGVDVIPDA